MTYAPKPLPGDEGLHLISMAARDIAAHYKRNPHPDDVTRLEREIVEAVEKVFGLGEED